jgi:hypothetical protein
MKRLLIAATVLSVVALPAAAAPITQTFDFSASIPGATVDPWTATFTLTYDSVVDTVNGVPDAFTTNLGSAYENNVQFYHNVGANLLVIGTNCGTGSCSIIGEAFFMQAALPSGGFVDGFVDGAAYGTLGGQNFGGNGPGVVYHFGLASTSNSVPEPLTLSLFGAGLAGAAFMRRRRKSRG